MRTLSEIVQGNKAMVKIYENETAIRKSEPGHVYVVMTMEGDKPKLLEVSTSADRADEIARKNPPAIVQSTFFPF